MHRNSTAAPKSYLATGAAAVLAATIAILVASTPASAATPAASGSPTTGLKNGDTVKVTGTGWPANLTVFGLECANDSGAQAACDIGHLTTITTNAKGDLAASIVVRTGTIGDGTCKAGSTQCIVALGTPDRKYTAAIHIAFAGAAKPSPSPTVTASTPSTTSDSSPAAPSASQAAPTGVNAGFAGPSHSSSYEPYALAAVAIGLLALATIGANTARGRRSR